MPLSLESLMPWKWLRNTLSAWAASVARPPFKRTVCPCKECASFCKTEPGALIPSDVPRIAHRLVEMKLIDREEDVGQFLRASRATTVYDRNLGMQVRVMKIGPARNRRGRCVFLDESDRCQIHGVSPFGCAYFDAHMPRAECDRRMLWGLVQIRSSPEYQSLRDTLPLAEDLSDHSKPAKGRKPGR